MERWKQYFEELLSDNIERNDTREADNTERKQCKDEEKEFNTEELEKAIKQLKNGKAPGSDTITTKMIKYMGEEGRQLDSLNWDSYHRVNSEQIYCYCGGNGEWYKQMLQCLRCKQWFHEKCISSLYFPLYCGDRFYVFVCSVCNHGQEYIRRMELKWVDLVHLMLFNLTVYNSRKYYDLDTVVVPYICDNWQTLQLIPKVANLSKKERRHNILSVLISNRNRFKCGREIKKRTTIWGLRVRLPPPAPCVALPSPHIKIDDLKLREAWQGNRRLLLLTTTDYLTDHNVTSSDPKIFSLMTGQLYLKNLNNSESESPCPSPGFDNEKMVVLIKKTNLLDCDTSSDETSSKSTLDLIIPPLKNFEGKNNPFLGLLKMGMDGSNRRKRGTDINLPLPLKTVISGRPMLRPMKRQLSDKNIIIGPNGEIRRKKRFRRNRSNMIVNNYGIGQPASKTATVLPSRSLISRNGERGGRGVDVASDLHDKTGSFSDPFSDMRRLRQRSVSSGEKAALPLSAQNTTKQSPANSVVPTPKLNLVKTESPDIDIQDLKSSVNIYFGAANRIARGERFTLLAKRVGPMGKVEFLIEWESPSREYQ